MFAPTQPSSTPSMTTTPLASRADADNATLASTTSRSSLASAASELATSIRSVIPIPLRGGCCLDDCCCCCCCGPYCGPPGSSEALGWAWVRWVEEDQVSGVEEGLEDRGEDQGGSGRRGGEGIAIGRTNQASSRGGRGGIEVDQRRLQVAD